VPRTPVGSGVGDEGATAELDDGTPVILRPAGHDDGPAILDGFARCSAGTRYFRFLSGGYQLTDERLNALTGADHRVHAVWLALERDAPGTPVASVARFVRSTEEPDVAEVAFIVADEYQGRGLGRLMLDALRVSAAVDGVTTFVAKVLAENGPMLALLLHRGAHVEGRDGPEMQVRMPLDGPGITAIDPVLHGALRDLAEAAAAMARAHDGEPAEEP
jgi:RimJ/RimL family protein N-acetyltransferase